MFTLPALVLYSLTFVYPVLWAFTNSLFEWRGSARGAFVGAANFQQLFTLQPYADQFGRALRNNLIFFGGTLVLQVSLGLLLAIGVNLTRRGRRYLQLIFASPFLMSALVVGYAWSLLLSPHFGVVNALLESAGLPTRVWLGEPGLVLPILILINTWQWSGAAMLIFGAALTSIPDEQVEAARIDGAGSWRIVRSVQLPQMVPAISIITILTFIGALNLFDLVYAVGGSSGGPGGSADVLGTLFYRISFGSSLNATGLSGALSVVQFLIILFATVAIRSGISRLGRRYE